MDVDGRTPDGTVAVVAPDRRWPERFAQAAATLRRVLPEALMIEHIGSTAVPGLVAKDTIDVLVVLPDLAIVRERAPALAVAGFDLRLGSPVTSEDHLFLRRVVDHHRTHHVHVLLPSSPEVGDYLVFRDYLRAHPEAATSYGEAKARLAAAHAEDRMAYVQAKPAVVAPVLADARTWAVATGR
ncbi:MAG TPA: GrpB family protein [Iamia sp.]|nr:GrpB family protein [Iamia sp.]